MARSVPQLHRLATLLPFRGASRRFVQTQTKAVIHGPTSPPLLEQTVAEHFRGIVKEHGDRIAVISQHQRVSYTYERLDRESSAVARGLRELGVAKGSRVAVSLGNNIEYATLTYAIFKLSAILVPLNPGFTPPQVAAALNHLSASHLVLSAETNLPYKPPRPNTTLWLELSRAGVPSLRTTVLVDNSAGRVAVGDMPGTTPYADLASAGPGHGGLAVGEEGQREDVINIQFTSGTTSAPKAACLTHRNILNNGYFIGAGLALQPGDVVCCPPPLFHCFGSILGYMATATHGATLAMPSEAFDAAAALATVRAHQAVALYGVPTMFVAVLEQLAASRSAPSSTGDGHDRGLSRLRTGIAAGSAVPATLMRRLAADMGLSELVVCYGMTETSPVSCMSARTDALEVRATTVGRPMPHVGVKVVDPADRECVLGVGERGELAVCGAGVMSGYWRDEARTGEVLWEEEGVRWMLTGDEGCIDADGHVHITGRIKDLIIRGGENIHPLEIEDCLFAHPSILEVSVVGVPCERYGEVVAAFVVVQAGKTITAVEVREWVRQRLSHHLVPKYVFWVDGYPKTASGKIQKYKLREMGAELAKKGKGLD